MTKLTKLIAVLYVLSFIFFLLAGEGIPAYAVLVGVIVLLVILAPKLICHLFK